jgi:hypothetical protein
MLVATWTLAYWALLLATRWFQGEAVWEGAMRWIMAGLAILGSALLGITGTLGGHLVGIYTEVSEALRFPWLGGLHDLLRAERHAGADAGRGDRFGCDRDPGTTSFCMSR